MAIELTAASAEELRRVMREQCIDNPQACLRVGIAPGVRRNFTLDLAERPADGDTIFQSHGIRVICAAGDLRHLDGFRIDFKEVGGARGFVFNPPPEKAISTRREGAAEGPVPDGMQVRDALRDVIDPEVGMNIVDLGLVYGVLVNQRNVRVTMTMTTPACPLGDQIKRDVHGTVMEHFPGVEQVDVEVVWDPPWQPSLISEEARKTLGWSR